MEIFWGYFSLICFILLLSKICTRKLGCVKADSVLHQAHKPLCCILLLSCVLHFIVVLPVFKTRALLIYITGVFMILSLIIMIIVCPVKRKGRTKLLKLHSIFAGLMFLCLIGHIAIYFMDFRDYQAKISGIQLQGVDAGNVGDGRYIGEYDAGYIYAKVQVEISNGTIQNTMLLEHENERGQTAEKVITDIIDTQKFPVDAITGATNSSKVIQMAVQKALDGSPVKDQAH